MSIKHAIAVSLIVLSFAIISIQPALASPGGYCIRKSKGVMVSGVITFTRDSQDVKYVGMPPPFKDDVIKCGDLPEGTNDVYWGIGINWGDGCTEVWESPPGQHLPWPATYTITHAHSPALFVSFGPLLVGGITTPVDKLGLLAPYIGSASTIVVATAATAIYIKRLKGRREN